MAPVAAKVDAPVDGSHAGSVSGDVAAGRRGKKRSADTPISVDDKVDVKRHKGGDTSISQHESTNGNGTDKLTGNEEELVSKRRETQDFVKLVTKAVTAAKDDR